VDVMDYEETYLGLCHPNASVVPATIAVGERMGASGKDVINALVVGNEVAIRVGLAMRPSEERTQQGGSAYTWHCFGSVASASKLMGLTAAETMNAFGFTGSSTALPTSICKWNRPLHWVKNNFQRQTDAGILGALMAQHGFMGPVDILDSDLGFWRMAGSDRYDMERTRKGLGKEYEILKVGFKKYPTCRWMHSTLDAVADIMKETFIKADEIDEIAVRTVSELRQWFVDYEPKSLIDAEFSIPYSVATLILGYEPGLEWFKEETLKDPEVLSLARRVRLKSTAGQDQIFYNSTVQMAGAEVEIMLKDGSLLRKSKNMETDDLTGSSENPIDIVEKFRCCAMSAGMEAAQAEDIVAVVEGLDELNDIADLTELFSIV